MTEPIEPTEAEPAESADSAGSEPADGTAGEETTLNDAVERVGSSGTDEPSDVMAPEEAAPQATASESAALEEAATDHASEDRPADVPAPEEDAESTDPAPVSEVDQEPVSLPDEAHSRTSELAARLRQSALAQVEAARARAAGADVSAAEVSAGDDAASDQGDHGDSDHDAGPDDFDADADATVTRVRAPQPTAAAPRIPALDLSHEPMSQPLAVAAAAVAEAVATGSQQSFLSGPAEPQERSGGNAVRLVTVIAGVLAIAAVVVLVIFDRSSAHDHSVDKARAAALVAARSETATALSYNYQTLDADFTKAEQGMSNTFRAKYAKTAATEVTPLAQKNQATSVGTIAAAGVISASSSKVSVLVFADQTNTNKLLGDKSRLDRSVIEVTMVKQSGHWVIDNLQPF